MLRKVLVALLIALLVFLLLGLWLPDRVLVSRAVHIDRPASQVFTLLNGFERFNEWSPWVERDATARYRLEGPATGSGARISWQGDPRLVGTGWLQITDSQPYERIDMRLDFGPQGGADSGFVFERSGSGVDLTWTFDVDLTAERGFFGGLLGRYLGLFMDRWVGEDFEQGLENLKRLAESAAVESAPGEPEIVEVAPQPILYVEGVTSQSSEDAASALELAYNEVGAFMTTHGITRAGQPMAITRNWDETGYRFEAAIPFAGELPELTGQVRSGMSPGGRAVSIMHRGSYERILETYRILATWMQAHGLVEGPVSWEQYLSDPSTTDEKDWVTAIYVSLPED